MRSSSGSWDVAPTSVAEHWKATPPPREIDDVEAATDDPHPVVKSGAAQSAASAVVCFVIYFFFCIVFASVVFDPLVSSPSDPPFGVAQGVGVNLLGIAVGSLVFSRHSGCKAVVGGPDLLPVIFAAECGTAVTAYLEGRSSGDGGDDHGDDGCGDGDASGDDDDGGAYGDGDVVGAMSSSSHERRRLASGDSPKLSASARAMVIPTTLVAMMIGNLLTGLLFVTLGKMNSTSAAIGFIPSSVISGFL